MALCLSNLGVTLGQQNHLEQAEPLLQRSLAMREEVFGPESPELSATLMGLAELLWKRGDLQNAEPIYRRNLAIRHLVNCFNTCDATA